MPILNHKYEKFRGGPSYRMSLHKVLRATINFRGLIYLNNRVYLEMGSPRAVALYFNAQDQVIAIQPAVEHSGESFEVQRSGSGWVVRASTFCRHYHFRIPNTEQFLRPEIDIEKTLHLSLRDTITVGGIKRKKKSPKPPTDRPAIGF